MFHTHKISYVRKYETRIVTLHRIILMINYSVQHYTYAIFFIINLLMTLDLLRTKILDGIFGSLALALIGSD